jgi:hypothetical protein
MDKVRLLSTIFVDAGAKVTSQVRVGDDGQEYVLLQIDDRVSIFFDTPEVWSDFLAAIAS